MASLPKSKWVGREMRGSQEHGNCHLTGKIHHGVATTSTVQDVQTTKNMVCQNR